MSQFNLFEQDIIGLTIEEAAVWRILKEHRGRTSAVKADALAWSTGLAEVKVRAIISGLVNEHGKLIASSTTNPAGFYIIENKEELQRHIRSLQHRGIACLRRAAALSKTSLEEIFRQGRLDIDGM